MTRLVIGLTGGIGTGKSAVSDRFSALGIVVADADVAARAVVAKGTPQSLAKTARAIPELNQARPSETSRRRLTRTVNFESKAEFRTCLYYSYS